MSLPSFVTFLKATSIWFILVLSHVCECHGAKVPKSRTRLGNRGKFEGQARRLLQVSPDAADPPFSPFTPFTPSSPFSNDPAFSPIPSISPPPSPSEETLTPPTSSSPTPTPSISPPPSPPVETFTPPTSASPTPTPSIISPPPSPLASSSPTPTPSISPPPSPAVEPSTPSASSSPTSTPSVSPPLSPSVETITPTSSSPTPTPTPSISPPPSPPVEAVTPSTSSSPTPTPSISPPLSPSVETSTPSASSSPTPPQSISPPLSPSVETSTPSASSSPTPPQSISPSPSPSKQTSTPPTSSSPPPANPPNPSRPTGLQVGFYKGLCPNKNVDIEATITAKVLEHFLKDETLLAAILRMQFHDCFVHGCDASILINGPSTEKTAGPNLSVRGYEFIDALKDAAEAECPDVVSCADIIAIATKELIKLGGGPEYSVQTGRRDGRVSKSKDVDLPNPFASVQDSIAAFAAKKFSPEEMVVLFGGHTVGKSHCSFFQDRLYANTSIFDPNMDPDLRQQLSLTCPQGTTANNFAFLDQNPQSSNKFDNSFFDQLLKGRGVIPVDQALARDPQTSGFVLQFAQNPALFNAKLASAMVKLQALGIHTSNHGEIRKVCSRVN